MSTTLCSQCGMPIVRVGSSWDHTGPIKPRHPAWPQEPQQELSYYERYQALAALLEEVDSKLAREGIEGEEWVNNYIMPAEVWHKVLGAIRQ